MLKLTEALKAWGSDEFASVLKNEMERLDARHLPLQQGLSNSSYALEDKFTVIINSTWQDGKAIQAKVGVFYSGIIAGCSCADDPSPMDEQNEYCEILLSIDKDTAQAKVTLLLE